MSPLQPKRQLLLLLVATPLMWGQPKVAVSTQNSSPKVPVLAQTAADRKAEGDRLLSESLQLWQTSQFPAAREKLQQALVIYREIGDRNSEGATLNSLGLVYKSLGEYPQALEFYQQALAITREVGNRAGEGATLNNLGTVYRSLGQYPQALEFFQQALAITREVGDHSGEGRTLNGLGLVYQSLGQYPQALEFFQQALAIKREVGDRFGEGRTLNGLGSVYQSLGQYQKVLEFLQQALVITREVGDRSGEGATLNGLGLVYDSLGQYPQALEFYQQALAITREVGNRAGEGTTLSNLGLVYQSLGEYPQALEFYQQALVIGREIGDRSGEGTTLNGLGAVYQSLGQYLQALEFYQQALAIRREVGDRAGEGTTLTNLGGVYQSLGQYPQALEFFQQALAIRREVGDRAGEGTTLNNLGGVYDSLGQYPQALEFFQQALAIIREVGDRAGEGRILSNLGGVDKSLGQYTEAESYLFDAIAVWESLRSTELGDEDKISLFDTQADTYRFLQDALIAQNKIETALEISERGRARAFVELMARRHHGDSSEEFVPPPPPTLADIQQVARDQNATLVEYSIIHDNLLYIWTIRPTGKIDFRQVDIEATTPGFSLNDWMTETHYALGVRSRTGETESEILATNLSEYGLPQLHQLLIEPIADLLPKTPEERVIFIPHGTLFQVPFPALKDANGTELIDKHTILTAPAIQVLQLTRKQRLGRPNPPASFHTRAGVGEGSASQGDALVVGNPIMPSISLNPGDPPMPLRPLPGSEQEAKDIAALLGTQPLIGSAATEPAVVERMKTARIVHLATHGILDEARGIGSSIALTPDSRGNPPVVAPMFAPSPNDGLLTAEEILGLKLNAELVVLSACDTGRGKVTGDGVVGLSRSLVTAGVSSLVVSLWQVPDGVTAQLMTQFYENLQQGQDKATALRNAMLATRATHPNPRNWAAFTLIGEIDPVGW